VNFTREPIIETIISPKEGYKLLVRSSKGESSEEYYVDAVEVVSFGRAFFFRSLERPKSFLVPVGDYEVLEVKETRVALKNVSYEKNIKIGGGREAPMRPAQREAKEVSEAEPASAEESALDTAVESRMERSKRDRRHRRKRRGGYDERDAEHKPSDSSDPERQSHGEEKAPPSFSRLIPPPSTLISETLSRYHDKEQQEKEPKEQKREDEEGPNADATTLHRASTAETFDPAGFESPYFIPYNENSSDTFF
jgi:hypothetical protein